MTVKPAKVSGVSLTYDAAKYKLLVKWKTVKSSGGYEIEYSSNADFKDSQVVKVTKLSKDNVYITVLDSEKTYYVRIRSYKKVSKKIYYSDWSKVKKINLKK